ncbi:MAG: HutD family protein, partial [Fusobacteriaceae bacterium]
ITREIYKDQDDFNIRISCAEIYSGESLFSDFTGYKRILKILENSVTLQKNSDKSIFLDKRDIFTFDGSDKIKSKNEETVLDFNVIYKSDYYLVSFEEIKGDECWLENSDDSEKVLVFSTENCSELSVDSCFFKLKKYDFQIFNNPVNLRLNGNFIIVKFSDKV